MSVQESPLDLMTRRLLVSEEWMGKRNQIGLE